MIIDKSNLDEKPKWSKKENNRWADLIELMCLYNEVVNPSDIEDLFLDNDYNNSLSRGGADHHEKSDKLQEQIKDYFYQIRYRKKVFGEYYPFIVEDDNSILCPETMTDEQNLYIFLLVCSSISFMPDGISQNYTSEFERFCLPIMSRLAPPESTVELFGTSRSGGRFHGNLKERIRELATMLHINTTRTFEEDMSYDRSAGGDNGIDIVYCLEIDDAQALPFSFAQCTCSYDKWLDKQSSVTKDKWDKIMEPIISYPSYMFVPFSCHNASGLIEYTSRLRTILIDRVRMVRLIIMNTNESFRKELRNSYDKIDIGRIYGEL